MSIGLMLSTSTTSGSTLSDIVTAGVRAESDGFHSVWVSGRYDALTQLALVAVRTTRIELGSAIVPSYPRHPAALAQQAASVQAVAGRRPIALGVGVSHPHVVRDQLCLDWTRPVAHMADYVTILDGLLAGEIVSHQGHPFSIALHQTQAATEVIKPSVLVAALSPRMCEVAGRDTDGAITWLAGPRVIADVAERLRAAARSRGRPQPRLVAGVVVCVTDDVEGARARIGDGLGGMASRSIYRGVLDREGVRSPEDIAAIGDEATVARQVSELAAAGATDVAAQIMGSTPTEDARSYALLARLANES